jgi:hypothetical protein
MPTISQSIQANKDRIETQQSSNQSTFALTPILIAPTPTQDLPVGLGLPQRGMFSPNIASVADRNDNARVFRGAGVRSASFPISSVQTVITKTTVPVGTQITPSPTPSPSPSPSPLPSGSGNLILATPNGATGASSLRSLVNADFPISGAAAGSYINSSLTINAQGIITAATNGSGGGSGGVVPVQVSSYGAQNSDSGKLVPFNSASPVTYTLLNSGVTSQWFVYVQNVGAGTLSINPNGLTLDQSSSSVSVTQNQGIVLFWDGSNYWTERGIGGGGGGGGTVTTSGSPANGNLTKFSGPSSITNTDLTGDITTSGSSATTLATVNSNVGSFTNANITVNSKGLITAAANGSGFSNPMTTKGDIIFENASPAPDRLAIGTTGQVLTVVSGLPAWAASSGSAAPFNNMLSPTTITAPSIGSLTWGNQGTSTAANNAGGALYMQAQIGGGASNIRHLYKAAPSTPWTFVVGFVPGPGFDSGGNQCGITMRLAASGKIISFWCGCNGSASDALQIAVDKYTNYTTFSAAYLSFVNAYGGYPVIWQQVTNDGTNFTWSLSIDGQNWKQFLTEAVTNYFASTPDQIGFGVNGFSSTFPTDAVIVHWSGI